MMALATLETVRGLRQKVFALLKAQDQEDALAVLRKQPPRRVIKPLISALYAGGDEGVRWRAVTAIGQVVADLAERDMEAARVVMRRFIWSLNDESGGIGWGAPEAMAEIMARHEGLAREYAHILVSYIRKDGNFLEYEPLQRGAVWGVGRLAEVRPELLRARDAGRHLASYLSSPDAAVRGLAAWALGLLGAGDYRAEIENLLPDTNEIQLYADCELRTLRVKDLAAEALAALGGG